MTSMLVLSENARIGFQEAALDVCRTKGWANNWQKCTRNYIDRVVLISQPFDVQV